MTLGILAPKCECCEEKHCSNTDVSIKTSYIWIMCGMWVKLFFCRSNLHLHLLHNPMQYGAESCQSFSIPIPYWSIRIRFSSITLNFYAIGHTQTMPFLVEVKKMSGHFSSLCRHEEWRGGKSSIKAGIARSESFSSHQEVAGRRSRHFAPLPWVVSRTSLKIKIEAALESKRTAAGRFCLLFSG